MFTKTGETEGAESILRLLTTEFTHWRPAFEKVRPPVLLWVSAVLKQLFKAWHLYPLGSWAHLGDGESRGSASFRNVSFGWQQLWGGYPDAPLSFFLKLSLKWPWPSTPILPPQHLWEWGHMLFCFRLHLLGVRAGKCWRQEETSDQELVSGSLALPMKCSRVSGAE